MATARALRVETSPLALTPVCTVPKMRALAWHGKALYASEGYKLLRGEVNSENQISWLPVAEYQPGWLRTVTSRTNLGCRLLRDGFHALAVLSSGHLVGAVPGAIVALKPGEPDFSVTFRVLRGTRPLHIAAVPGDTLFWGEYFDNPHRDEVHIYASSDRGQRWDIAYTFAERSIRHVHNIVFDKWGDCLWILTGDNGSECRILRAPLDLSTTDVVLSGNQQARCVAVVPAPDGIYFSTDSPLEQNFVYRLDRTGKLSRVAGLGSSSIYGCAVGSAIFFSTMVEPSAVNLDRHSRVFASADTNRWENVLSWKKDRYSQRFFQYGNAIFPDGDNGTHLLALTTVAVEDHDLETSLWRVEHPEST